MRSYTPITDELIREVVMEYVTRYEHGHRAAITFGVLVDLDDRGAVSFRNHERQAQNDMEEEFDVRVQPIVSTLVGEGLLVDREGLLTLPKVSNDQA